MTTIITTIIITIITIIITTIITITAVLLLVRVLRCIVGCVTLHCCALYFTTCFTVIYFTMLAILCDVIARFTVLVYDAFVQSYLLYFTIHGWQNIDEYRVIQD